MVAHAEAVSGPETVNSGVPGEGRRKLSAAAYGYALAALAVILGWIVTRQYQLVDPLYGFGYWLGIVGASLMGVLLLYPVRKRIRALRYLGPTRYWFQMHMFFGVLGPILILYHCNFRFGSLNSNIALICTLLVAGSGLVGRYLYTRIYSDLEDHRRSFLELSERARLTKDQVARTASMAPKLFERMQTYDRLVLSPPRSLLAGLLLPAKLAITTRLAYVRLAWLSGREIRREAGRAGVSKAQTRKVKRAIREMLGTHLRRVRRVAEFHSYEQLFSLWHVFHLPFFYILVITALVHVLAVHMY